MSSISNFFKKNKAVKQNAFYAATDSLKDESGQPLLWEIKPVTTKEEEAIRAEFMTDEPVPGKRGVTRPKLDTNGYVNKLTVESVVCPDLFSAELQDSYGVKTPEDLIKEMLDSYVEYNKLVEFITTFNGLDVSLADKAEEVKN